MRLSTLGFIASEAVQNVRRNPVMAMASITTAAISLLILGVFLLVSVNLNLWTHTVEGQVEVEAFFRPHTPARAEAAAVSAVRRWRGVQAVSFVSRAQVLRSMRREYGSVLTALGNHNPLLDEMNVKVYRPRDVRAAVLRLRRMPAAAHVTYQSRVVERLFQLGSLVRMGGIVFAALLALGALLVIHNAIRVAIFARRREVAIMRLVGATDGLVRGPFLLEGTLLGLAGALVAVIVVGVGYHWAMTVVQRSLPFLPLAPIERVVPDLLEVLGLGVVIGYIGSRLSLRGLMRG